jgi:LemA protein
MRILLIVLGVIAVLAVIIGMSVASTYNGFVTKSQAVDAQWGNVETQLQRRFDLIPNLVEATKGIFEQERAVFEAIAEARTRYAGAQASGDVDAEVDASNGLNSALARLLVVVENYPEIRSQQNVTQLMDELAGTENRIAVERTRFNERAQEYNTSVQQFPGGMVASMFGYKVRPYFQTTPGSNQVPQVQF